MWKRLNAVVIMNRLLIHKMKKIIFLDFDGVMDTAYYDHYLVKNGLPETDKYGCVFDPDCIKALAHIIEDTGASIVVSSTWKDFMPMEQILQMWKDRNLPGEVIDATPTVSKHRGDEIDAWFAEYGKPCQYVILDDLPFSEFNLNHYDHFLMVNAYHGLDEEIAERAIAILQTEVKDKQTTSNTEKVLVIPDVHGREFWRKPIARIDEYEKVIFLGDYLDPYEFEFIPIERAIEGFLDIIALKRQYPNKVVLLLGNHDLHYWWDNDMDCSRRDILNLGIIHRLFMMNRDCFQLAYYLDAESKNYLFTHAGVLSGWFLDNIKFIPSSLADDLCSTNPKGMASWLNCFLNGTGFGILGQVSAYRGGFDGFGSPVWADYHEHETSNLDLPYYQIFGHTQQEQYPVITDNWACLDCRQCFILDINNQNIHAI